MTGVVRQAIVSASCEIADIWPFAVKIFVRSRSYRSLSRIVILFTGNSPTQVEHLGCGDRVAQGMARRSPGLFRT